MSLICICSPRQKCEMNVTENENQIEFESTFLWTLKALQRVALDKVIDCMILLILILFNFCSLKSIIQSFIYYIQYVLSGDRRIESK